MISSGPNKDDFSDIAPKQQDPVESEKIWYRHRMDGQRGFLVERDGKHFIKLDRPNEEILKPWSESTKRQWIPDVEARGLQPAQIGRIAFEADKQLCLEMGDHDRARREWPSLPDRVRQAFIERGPDPEMYPERHMQWTAIMLCHKSTEVYE